MKPDKFTVSQQSKYLRIPFRDHGNTFRGCDCGGLVWLIFKNELGVELPNWRDRYSCTRIEYADEVEETVSTMLGSLCEEVSLEDRQPFDVVSFAIHGHDVHVGTVVDKEHFIHIMAGRTNVTVERFDSPQWKKRVTGCFRYIMSEE